MAIILAIILAIITSLTKPVITDPNGINTNDGNNTTSKTTIITDPNGLTSVNPNGTH